MKKLKKSSKLYVPKLMLIDKNSIYAYKSFSEEIIKKAGLYILKNKNKIYSIEHKKLQDIVTSVDLKSENILINSIIKKYPNHQILSEEKGLIGRKSEFKWIIDPLDGTKEYAKSLPLYNVSLALQYKNQTIVSCVYRPQDNSLYSAGIYFGSFLNNKPINPSKTKKINEAFVYCYIPSFHREKDIYENSWEKLKIIGKNVYRLRSLSDENSALCWLAHGGIDAYVNLGYPPKIHDVIPGYFIAKCSGSKFCDLNGHNLNESKINSFIASCNLDLQKNILQIISE